MKIGNSQHGLGDTILLTAIAFQKPDSFTVQLPPEQERFACLFQGLANVEICPAEKINVLRDIGGGHYTLRKLRGLFGSQAEKMNIKPFVTYSDEESEVWAKNYLSDKQNPVIICPFVSKNWSKVRDIPKNIVEQIICGAKEKNETPIVVQDVDFDWGVDSLQNLELPKLICLLRRCKKLYTANTGIYHLGVALNVPVECYMPKDSPLFNSTEWCYESTPTIQHYTW